MDEPARARVGFATFDPTNEFLDWLVGYARGRLVFDVGCGEGELVFDLHERGVHVRGIDPNHQNALELTNRVLTMKAQEAEILRLTRDALVLFCRPCHNGFVSETIEIIHPSTEILYISRPENVGCDLPRRTIEIVATPPCSCEKVYRVLRSGGL